MLLCDVMFMTVVFQLTLKISLPNARMFWNKGGLGKKATKKISPLKPTKLWLFCILESVVNICGSISYLSVFIHWIQVFLIHVWFIHIISEGKSCHLWTKLKVLALHKWTAVVDVSSCAYQVIGGILFLGLPSPCGDLYLRQKLVLKW